VLKRALALISDLKNHFSLFLIPSVILSIDFAGRNYAGNLSLLINAGSPFAEKEQAHRVIDSARGWKASDRHRDIN